MPVKRVRHVGKAPEAPATAEALLPEEEARSVPGDGQEGDRAEGGESSASMPVNPDSFGVTHGLRDVELHSCFQFRTSSRALRDQVSTAVAKMKANPPQRCPLVWDTLVYTDHGLRCQWKNPRRTHTAWALFIESSSSSLEEGMRRPGGSSL